MGVQAPIHLHVFAGWVAVVLIGGFARGQSPTAVDAPGAERETASVLSSDEAPLDRNQMAEAYQSAKAAFQRRDWTTAAAQYRRVQRCCPGSPLALECGYMANQADWQSETSGTGATSGCYEKMSQWLVEAEAYRTQHHAVQSASESAADKHATKLDGWIDQTHRMLTQWERAHQKFDALEARLKALLHTEGCTRDAKVAWPKAIAKPASLWLELGLVHSRQRRNPTEAIACLNRAMELGELSIDEQCTAHGELAMCCLAKQDFAAAASNLERLASLLEGSSAHELAEGSVAWQIRLAILKSRLHHSQGQLAEAARILEPVIGVALTGHPEVALAYELAIALLEAGQNASAEQVMLEIIHRVPGHPIAIEARVRLAKQRADQGDWKACCKWIDEAVELGCPETLAPHAYWLRGRARIALQLPQGARDDLVLALNLRSESGDAELETAIRFDLAEALAQMQLWNEAEPHWEFLIRNTMERTGENGATGETAPANLPAWMATIWLRQGEMLAAKRRWEEAEKTVYQIRAQFPECNRLDEVDYLLARCLVTKAQFDDARRLLIGIASNPSEHSSELVARSWWLVGETYLMQRNLADAVASYQRVLGTESSRYWQSAAWMQMGQCYELQRDVSSARAAYQRVIDGDADGTLVPEARRRLESLSIAPPSAELSREGLGGKPQR
ncbi:MAG: tetratricopeptide repeat protein [Pirellula sp.]